MPDDWTHSADRADGPNSWGEAFAALPQALPEDGWARLSAALAPAIANVADQREVARPFSRWPVWLALAATLAAVMLIPLTLRPDAVPTVDIVADRDRLVLMPASPISAASETIAPVAMPTTATAPDPTDNATLEVAQPRPADQQVATAPNLPQRKLPATAALQPEVAAERSRPAVTADRDVETAIAALQAESARLEAVVMQMGDERVSSAPALVLLDDMITRVAAIDSALATPPADAEMHLQLWEQRVLTMRELATMTTTQRWLAVRGEGYSGGIAHVN